MSPLTANHAIWGNGGPSHHFFKDFHCQLEFKIFNSIQLFGRGIISYIVFYFDFYVTFGAGKIAYNRKLLIPANCAPVIGVVNLKFASLKPTRLQKLATQNY